MLIANVLQQKQVSEAKPATVWTGVRLVLVGAYRLTAIEDIYKTHHFTFHMQLT